MMRRNVFGAWLSLAVLVLGAATFAGAQTRRGTGARQPVRATAQAGAVVPLPASDAVLLVDMRRLVNEAMPRVLANDAAKLAAVNADIEEFKTTTGIDARSFERVALGARFTNPSPDVTKIDHVVGVAHGTFNEAAIVAAVRLKSSAAREEKLAGKTIHIFTLDEQVKFFGVMPRMRVKDLAVTALDANTLVVGEPEAVRATVNAGVGRGRISPALVGLARQNPSAIVGFGANIPASLLRKVDGFGSDEVQQSIASIRQIYGSVAMTPNGYDVLTTLRAATAADAQRLAQTITALKPLGSFAASQLSGDKRQLALKALDSLRINAQGTDVQLKLDFAQSDIATMLRVF